MRKSILWAAPTIPLLILGATGCAPEGSGGGDSAGDESITVAYQTTATYTQVDALMKKAKQDFEAANPDITVELEPIQAEENDYATKLALMQRSPDTAPDVFYEDSFRVRPDAEAGYLLALDEYLAEWEDWDTAFIDSAKQAGAGSDGKTYAVPMGTDTRALWYNKAVFEQAGLPIPWEPKTWQDVLDAAETVKAAIPDAVPFNIYSGTGMGEAASMQGFEMLLYGTDDTLYDTDEGKWVVGSQGFRDSLQFISDVYVGDLGPDVATALDSNYYQQLNGEGYPTDKVGASIDGSWIAGSWLEGGPAPWPEWSDVMGVTPMPTQDGQDPGATSMSGGWTLAVGSGSGNPDAAFEFVSTALNKDNSLSYNVNASQVPVRSDVAEDPAFTGSSPVSGFFSDLVEVTHYRPTTSDYAEISGSIQQAMEAVMTGEQSVEEAAAAYDEAVTSLVGEDNVLRG
ncbi:extracellular solute-binding protein [Arthrobacter agilis]|uniref:extracellular solute-binding protein n=1 Tax=Arthrobacter agilis TaxID=37921 RepID=UPI002784085B|nr:extracellular solute-binding protein [Arthrobacter agilis]MDQ0735881.1 multiple sugar transport system substrate-binding protein [Arthrobacter agilis]